MAGLWIRIVGQLILEGMHASFMEAVYEPRRGHLGRVRAGDGGAVLGEGRRWRNFLTLTTTSKIGQPWVLASRV